MNTNGMLNKSERTCWQEKSQIKLAPGIINKGRCITKPVHPFFRVLYLYAFPSVEDLSTTLRVQSYAVAAPYGTAAPTKLLLDLAATD